MPRLEVDSLEVRYGPILGTRGLSFSLEAGKTLALVGSNGAGKSSTIKVITGMHRQYGGSIRWNGKDLRTVPPADIVREKIALSPEGRRVFAAMSVRDNLRIGAFSTPGDDFESRAEQMYGYFPRLKERQRQAAGSLSGGEQQMLAIARALMSAPKLFLLDEPSLGLAPIVVERIGDILREIQAREQLSVILAEQNANWAMRLADQVVILDLGVKVKEGDPRELMQDASVQAAYLGI